MTILFHALAILPMVFAAAVLIVAIKEFDAFRNK